MECCKKFCPKNLNLVPQMLDTIETRCLRSGGEQPLLWLGHTSLLERSFLKRLCTVRLVSLGRRVLGRGRLSFALLENSLLSVGLGVLFALDASRLHLRFLVSVMCGVVDFWPAELSKSVQSSLPRVDSSRES